MRWLTATLLLMAFAGPAWSQFPVPAATAPDGATLFQRQCAACHVAVAAGGVRQGPNLWGVVGRKAGTRSEFKYSGGYAASGIVWTEAALDSYLTNPQAMIPGSVMVYRQANAEIRQKIIAWLKDQH
jgi:cytochrome c